MTKLDKMLNTLEKYQGIAWDIYQEECHSEDRNEEHINKAYGEWSDLNNISKELKRCASSVSLMKDALSVLDFDLNREV